MRLISENDAVRYPSDLSCRHWTVGAWVLLACSLVILAVTVHFARDPSVRWVMAIAFVFMAIIVYTLVLEVVAVHGPRNWVFRVGADAWLVKFRSFRNRHLPDSGPTIIAIAPEEVAEVRVHEEDVAVESDRPRRAQHVTYRYLELRLKRADDGAVQAALEAERKARRTTARSRHFPVTMPAPDLLRITWLSPEDRIEPGLEQTVEVLRSLFGGRS